MNRRDFLRLLLASPVAEFVDYEKLLWIPGEVKIFLPPSDPLGMFFDLDKLHGIQYHQSNAFTGEWLGLSRLQHVQNELTSMIYSLEEHRK